MERSHFQSQKIQFQKVQIRKQAVNEWFDEECEVVNEEKNEERGRLALPSWVPVRQIDNRPALCPAPNFGIRQ
jgi:hypothetical protein